MYWYVRVNRIPQGLTHWGRDKLADIFTRIFFNENVWISIKILLKFVPKGPINNIPSLVQIMAWCRPGDKPLFEPMMVRWPTRHSVSMSLVIAPILIIIVAGIGLLSDGTNFN